jgi:hypothetical protein
MFIVVIIYFVIDSVQKLLDTPLYVSGLCSALYIETFSMEQSSVHGVLPKVFKILVLSEDISELEQAGKPNL